MKYKSRKKKGGKKPGGRMNRLAEKNPFIEYCLDKKWIFIATLGLSIIMVVLLYNSAVARAQAFVINDGQVTGVKAEEFGAGVTLHLVAEQEDISLERDVTLIRSKSESGAETYELVSDPAAELDTEITQMVRSINRGTGESADVELPESIGDLTTLNWSANETKGSWLVPLMFPPLVMLFLYRGRESELKKQEKDEVTEIVNELPSFNNKLVLLLGSGLVYEESLKRIAGGYIDQDEAVAKQFTIG